MKTQCLRWGLLVMGSLVLGMSAMAQVTVGFSNAAQKIEMLDDQVVGPVADVWDTIARRAEITYKFLDQPPKQLSKQLNAGRVQVALTLRRSDALETIRFLQEPLYVEVYGLWHWDSSNPMDSLTELVDIRPNLGVLRGANNVTTRLKSLDTQYRFETVNQPKQLFALLNLKRIEYGYMDFWAGRVLQKSQKIKGLVFSELDSVPFHISIYTGSEEGQALFERLQTAHAELVDNGVIVELLF